MTEPLEACAVNFVDVRFSQGEQTGSGRSATVDFRVACCQKLLVTNDRSDACVLRLAA